MPTASGYAHVPEVRNANYQQMKALLEEMQTRRVDVVVPAEKVQFAGGMLQVSGVEADVSDEGVTTVDGSYQPTVTFDGQLAERLSIPSPFLRQLRLGRTDKEGKLLTPPRLDLYDSLANGLLHGREEYEGQPALPPDRRSFLGRLLTGEPGVARSLLSNSYRPLENYDGLEAVRAGIINAGVDPDSLRITGDLTENKMYLRITAPGILTAAPDLLRDYRSPFGDDGNAGRRQGRPYSLEERVEAGRRWLANGGALGHRMFAPGSEPLVCAGCIFSNSETGNGRWSLVPFIELLLCSNGMRITRLGYNTIHRGARMEEGMVEWSRETQTRELLLVASQTTDTVRSVFNQGWLDARVGEIEARAGKPLGDPERTIQVVSRRLGFTESERAGILRMFLLGGQDTSAGVANAVSAYAQAIENTDRAYEVGDKALEALELAFAMS